MPTYRGVVRTDAVPVIALILQRRALGGILQRSREPWEGIARSWEDYPPGTRCSITSNNNNESKRETHMDIYAQPPKRQAVKGKQRRSPLQEGSDPPYQVPQRPPSTHSKMRCPIAGLRLIWRGGRICRTLMAEMYRLRVGPSRPRNMKGNRRAKGPPAEDYP